MTRLKPRTAAAVVLYDGDDQEELALLKRAADAALRAVETAEQRESSEMRRLGDDAAPAAILKVKAQEAQDAFDAFVDAAAERAVEVRVRHIGRTPFRRLMQEHPPRMVESEPDDEGKTRQVTHEEDQGYEVNTETFPMALLIHREGDIHAVCAPEFETAEELQAFLDLELSEGDFDQLWTVAYAINRNPSADPSRFRYSHESLSSTGTAE